MQVLSKLQRKALRECANRMYEIEVTQELAQLEADFKRWRNQELEIDQLLESIHQFHQTKARSLWSTYTTMKPTDIVARGLVLQLIPASEVPEDLRQHLAPRVQALTSVFV